MIGIEVDTDPAAQLLSGIRGRVERPRPLLEGLSTALVQREREAFATGGFGRWSPLAPATVRAKGHRQVLIDTGGLLRLLSSRSSIRVTATSVEITVNHPGAYYNRRGARGMPVRDAVPASTGQERRQWARATLGFIARGVSS